MFDSNNKFNKWVGDLEDWIAVEFDASLESLTWVVPHDQQSAYAHMGDSGVGVNVHFNLDTEHLHVTIMHAGPQSRTMMIALPVGNRLNRVVIHHKNKPLKGK